MKKPTKPYQPSPPTPPKKEDEYWETIERIELDDGDIVDLDPELTWFFEQDYTYENAKSYCYLRGKKLSLSQNEHYDKDLKSYQQALKRHEKKMFVYESKMKEYELEMKEYRAWEKAQKIIAAQKQEELERKLLEELKAKYE
jgi:hypothetical protein